MTALIRPLLTAILALALAFTFSCTLDSDDNTPPPTTAAISSSGGSSSFGGGGSSSSDGSSSGNSSSSGGSYSNGGSSSSGGSSSGNSSSYSNGNSSSSAGVLKCNGIEYDTATQFCYSNSLFNYCGINPQTYNPNTYECKPSINPNGIYLKTPVSYEGKNYNAVLIGTQTWMAENLNYNATGSKCGNGSSLSDANTVTCDTYGRLYDWATAMGILSSYNSSLYNPSSGTKYRGVCPDGWHIPNNAEWVALMTVAGGPSTAGTKLKARSGWGGDGNGTDDYGFSALPGGYGISGGNFITVGDYGYWWSSSEHGSTDSYFRSMLYNYENVYYAHYDKKYLLSVRCLQD